MSDLPENPAPENSASDGAPQPGPSMPPPTARYAPPPQAAQFSQPAQPPYGAPLPQAAQPQAAQPQGAQPQGFQPQFGGPRPPKKGLSTGALIGIIAGGAVLLLLIVGSILAAVFLTSSSRGSGPGAHGSPAETVEGYLQALADGDADTAKGYLSTLDASPLLTQDALAASQKIAPISAVSVDPESVVADEFGSATVTATFKVGDEPAKRDFRLFEGSDGWSLLDGTVNVSLYNLTGLSPEVNGVEVDEEFVYGFPGAFQIEVGNDRFEIGEDAESLVIVSTEDEDALNTIRPTLTEAAKQEFRDLVRASLNECLAMKTLATPCTADLSGDFMGGEVPIEDTVTRSLTAEGEAALSALDPEPGSGQPTLVRTFDPIPISITLDAEKDGMRGTGEVQFGGGVRAPSVDFAQPEPSVTWN